MSGSTAITSFVSALRFCFITILCVAHFGSLAIQLSNSSRVSLLTCAPGQELYSAFGHNGIRVTDFTNNFDVVFNYGTFDFEQPGFYTNFLKGEMRYMLSTDRYESFYRQYVYEKRKVTEQELNLSTEDRQKIFAFLFNNALPENREYYYDFFWDNCATRPRDVFEQVLGKRLQYHPEKGHFEQHKTMHDMLRVYVSNRPWVDFGFDLILGMPCEVEATPRHQTFLPDYLAEYFASATIDGNPFAINTAVILDFPPATIEVAFRPIHLTVLISVLGFILLLVEWKKKTHYFGFDAVLLFVLGLIGTLFLALWIFSSHYSVPQNLNLFWLLPTHLIVSIILLFRQKPRWLAYYFSATAVIMLLLLLTWKWNPQHYNLATMPLIILIGVRSYFISAYIKHTHP